MDCKQVREVLDLYVNGELSASAAAATSLHLAACEKASSALGRLAVRSSVRHGAGFAACEFPSTIVRSSGSGRHAAGCGA